MNEAIESRAKLHANQLERAYFLQFYMKIEKLIVFDENVLSELKTTGSQSSSGFNKFYLLKRFQRLLKLSVLKGAIFP